MKNEEAEVERKAKRQYGLISRAQALEAGVSASAIDRRLGAAKWFRYFPGVYRLAGAPASDEQRILGACLALGPRAMASHTTAAFLWQLDGVGRPMPEPIEVSAPRDVGRVLRGVVIHHPRDLATAGKAKRLEIPTTHLARTLVDLASAGDSRRLEQAFDTAWRRKGDLPRWIPRYVEEIGGRGRDGVHQLLALAARRQLRPTDSVHEDDVLKFVRRARLPTPTLQHSIFDGRGFIARVDFAWVAQRVVLFADSWGHHHSRRSFDLDHEQRERLAAAGWTSVEVSPRLVETGSWLEALARHLQRANRALAAPAH